MSVKLRCRAVAAAACRRSRRAAAELAAQCRQARLPAKRLSHSRGRFAVALADDNGNVWDSGKVFSDRSVLVPYGGPALQPGKAYCWKVQAWDADGNLSPWSLPASFGTGLMSMQDWNGAKWIAMEPDVDSLKCIEGNTGKWKDGGPVFDKPVAPYKLPQLRREFTATKPVKRAMAYICGLGQFEMFSMEKRSAITSWIRPGRNSTKRRNTWLSILPESFVTGKMPSV